MNPSPNDQESRRTPEITSGSNTISRFFWVTILMLAALTIVLALIGILRNPEPAVPEPFEVPETTLETILGTVAKEAQKVVVPEIGPAMKEVYAPVYEAIPKYADFHYSVLGEYTELTAAVLGRMESQIRDQLFHEFEQRTTTALESLDKSYVEAYRNALDKELAAVEIPEEQRSLPIGEMTRTALEDAVNRAKTTLPLATTAAVVAGSGVLQVTTTIIAKKIAAAIAAKAALKGAAKSTGILGGAGGGALLCSPAGPVAILCGVAGGIAAWFTVDVVVIRIDEYFNRDEFEAELRALVDADKARKHRIIRKKLDEKAARMDAATKEIMKGFTLRDLSSGDRDTPDKRPEPAQ